MKECKKCKKEKELSKFHKNKNFVDGRKTVCKFCISEQKKEYYNKNKNKISKQSKKSYLKNKDKAKKRANNYYHNNKEEVSKKMKLYREENEEKIKIQKKKYYQENKEDIIKKTKSYAKNNKDKINEYRVNYEKKNKHIIAWRSVLKSQLRRFGTSKESSTLNSLGYSAEDLKQHLENLFTPEMTWNNHGEWHIDHIKPISKFNIDTLPSIVNSLDNLQPLWSTTREINGIIYEGNINKGNN